MKRLLLLGGGHAQVHVLKSLGVRPLDGVAVTLVTPFARQMYSGMVPGLVAGHYTVDQCVIPLAPLAARAGVELIEDEAVALDAAERRVTLAGAGLLDYDWLSIDTGSVMHRDALPGAGEHALFVRPIERFVQQLAAVDDAARARALEVVLVGGGAAGVELAMALAHRLRGAGDGGSRISLVAGAAPLLEGYPPSTRHRAQQWLQRWDIAVLPAACVALDETHVQLANGARLACNLAVLATGAQPPLWLRDSGLALDERGFVATGPTLQSLSHAEVFAAGDVAGRPDAPHPKSGVYAVRAGPPLAHNLRAAVAGSAMRSHRPQSRTLNLLSCGGRQAIASWGGWSAQGRWPWWWKDRIDRGFVARLRGTA